MKIKQQVLIIKKDCQIFMHLKKRINYRDCEEVVLDIDHIKDSFIIRKKVVKEIDETVNDVAKEAFNYVLGEAFEMIYGVYVLKDSDVVYLSIQIVVVYIRVV